MASEDNFISSPLPFVCLDEDEFLQEVRMTNCARLYGIERQENEDFPSFENRVQTAILSSAARLKETQDEAFKFLIEIQRQSPGDKPDFIYVS